MSVTIATNTAFTRDQSVLRESWYIAAIGLFLCIAGIWQQSFIDFESRFALFAQEMLRHGPTLFPTTYGQPYPDYPVTGTLLIWLCSLPFGTVTKFSAVLPTAIASALNFMLLYRLLAPLSRRWALMALCMQLMTITYLTEARSLSLDQMVATITLAAFYLMHTLPESARTGLPRALPLLLLAGFAVRGPLGVVIPAAVVGGYCAVTRSWRALWQLGVLAFGVLAIMWGALLLLSAKLYGMPFMWSVVDMQVFGRLEAQQTTPTFYYFFSSLGNYALAYPLALLVIAAIGARVFNISAATTNKLLLGLIVWVAIVMMGLSIPHVKKARYLLPIVPALAALAAYPWYETPTRVLIWIKIVGEKLFSVFPLLFIVAIAVIHHRAKHHHGGVHLPLPLLYAALVLAQCAAAWIYVKSARKSRPIKLAMIAAGSLWLVLVIAIEPAQRQLHDTARFVTDVEAMRAQKAGALALFGMKKDGEAIKYLVNVPHDISPLFVNDTAAIDQLERPVYVMINDRDIDAVSASAATQNRLTIAARVLTGYFDGHAFSVFYLPQ